MSRKLAAPDASSSSVRAYSPRPNARKTPPSTATVQPQAAFPTDQLPLDRIVVGDCISVLRRLPARCVDLVILDPPYWKVVGEAWDYRWRTEDDYRAWCRLWFAEVARVCKRSASIYLFGYLRNLVHLYEDVIDVGFEFRQELVVDKGMKSLAGRKTSTYKQFPNTTEMIFFFVYNAKPEIKSFLKGRAKELGLTGKEINQRLGVKSNGGGVWSLYTGNNILAQVPTREMWEKLERVLEVEAPEDLKGFTFETQMGLTNVWQDIDFYSEKRIHRTQKPLRLIERLLLASSHPGDLVLDPFAGSGSTALASRQLGRRSLSIEIDEGIAAKAERRLEAAANAEQNLFAG